MFIWAVGLPCVAVWAESADKFGRIFLLVISSIFHNSRFLRLYYGSSDFNFYTSSVKNDEVMAFLKFKMALAAERLTLAKKKIKPKKMCLFVRYILFFNDKALNSFL